MKILYAIQGTGNGHISRARDIIPVLQKYGDLDILVSGCQVDLKLNYPVQYHFYGVSFIFGKRGGINVFKTLKSIKLLRFVREIWNLNVHQYDLVINDFEPVAAWSCLLKNKKCVGLSHQSAVIRPFAPKPAKTDLLGYLILRYYAPVQNSYGFHFRSYDDKTNTPIIRQEVRDLKTTYGDFYTVYLPSYSDERIIKVLSQVKGHFKVFSKHSITRRKHGHIDIIPVNNQLFLKSLADCRGVICGAGFEGPSEALYLQKKLLVIPMRGQYEQQCNAAALEKLGVKVLKSLHVKHLDSIKDFILTEGSQKLFFPNQTSEIIHKVVSENVKSYHAATEALSFS